MAFIEDVEVSLLTESHVVEHIKGVELEIVSNKLIAHTETELKNLHTHKLKLSYEAAEALYIKLGQRLKTAQELVEDDFAIITE
ncbi:hypothetical protein VITU102760_24955 [Vibrio tubiashii]|uniref:Uncharacterized protein n=1 Tax=Vibrio tubiashii ATCC 19109 TaxID=1051646 RepID=F9T6Q0_9VIBR|nr:hypothetical protein [Vibrio tubiashii]AIW17526.1 hypothetical protein IX91_26065 [Vibrio tubiashii ATCC 19109]EGU54455.1 hypothetical protein VITU9109_02737 [Vibrio tubiashii ATCC 19109]EIF05899.1 hypothetical protein VT1337_01080 [Vibrio tubiashii NCIMB 1337 = ATCC 19106]